MSSSDFFNPKQVALIRDFKQGRLARINILVGAVRSGKTWVSLILWGLWVASMPKNGTYLMVGKTMTSLRRNCLDLMENFFGSNFSYSFSAKEGRLFGRRIYLEGVNDARAEGKIRGITLTGAYCDELSLFTQDFFVMLLSRLSQPGAKLFGTTNPDYPGHWLKKDYLDRASELDIKVYAFSFADNLHLDQGYKDALCSEYVGVFYERFILGLWVAAEGAVYGIFANNRERFRTRESDYDYIVLGLDFGGSGSAHAITATGLKNDASKLTVLASRRIDAVGTTPDDLFNAVAAFAQQVESKYGNIALLRADSAEQTLINGLRVRLWFPVMNALKRKIVDRIRATTALMTQGRLYLTDDCASLEQAFCDAVYKTKGAGEDERLDDGTSDIDSLDSFEYSWEKEMPLYVRTLKGDSHD